MIQKQACIKENPRILELGGTLDATPHNPLSCRGRDGDPETVQRGPSPGVLTSCSLFLLGQGLPSKEP